MNQIPFHHTQAVQHQTSLLLDTNDIRDIEVISTAFPAHCSCNNVNYEARGPVRVHQVLLDDLLALHQCSDHGTRNAGYSLTYSLMREKSFIYDLLRRGYQSFAQILQFGLLLSSK